MITIDKGDVEIVIPKDEKREKALLISELVVALINVAKHLNISTEQLLHSIIFGVMITDKIDEVLDELKDEIEKEEQKNDKSR